ncbi:MAG: NUDIX hydrolase [Anaerolineae bacterium]|nr:NUDIX hydrolase [Anaerolineae bacterium]
MAKEHIIKSRTIFEGRVVNLRIDTVKLDDAHTYEREIIQHAGAVALVPLDENGDVLLVRQYRAGAQQELLELPAGGLEPGEGREECARRELQEEIGFYPEKLEKLGSFWVAASYTTESITIYLASVLRPARLQPDKDERIDVVRMPFAEALQSALTNQIEDSKTLIGLMWAARHLGKLK